MSLISFFGGIVNDIKSIASPIIAEVKNAFTVYPSVVNTAISIPEKALVSELKNVVTEVKTVKTLPLEPVLNTANPLISAVKNIPTKVGLSILDKTSYAANYATSGVLPFVKSVAGAAVVAGGGLAVVPALFNATKKATQVAVPILVGDKPLTADSLGSIGDFIGSSLGAGITGAAIGAGSALIYDKLIKTGDAITKAADTTTTVLPSAVNSLPTAKDITTPNVPKQQVPLTPATQILGKPVSTGQRRKSAKKKQVSQSTGIRINIINDSYLRRSSYTY